MRKLSVLFVGLSLVVGLLVGQAEAFEYGYKAGVVPSLDLSGDPTYEFGVSGSHGIGNGLIAYVNIKIAGLLDLSATSDDHAEANLEIRYKLQNGNTIVLSHKQVSVSGDGVVSRTYGKGNLSQISVSKNF